MTQMSELDRIRQRRKPVQRSWKVVLDPEIADEVAKLQARVSLATIDADRNPSLLDDATKAAEELDRLVERLEAETETFTFQALGRRTFEALLDAHPSANEGELYDVATFPPVLLQASCISHEMTLKEWAGYEDEDTGEHVDGLWDELPRAECEGLFATAWGVNWDRPSPLSDSAIARMRRGERNSTIASSADSHTAGS